VTSLLNQLEYDSAGLDISKYALRVGERVDRIEGDAENLPFKSDVIDVITCFDTFEHLIRPTLLLKESYRCLRRGGVLIIENPVANPIDIISDRLHKMRETHCSVLAPKAFISLVQRAGFYTAKRGLMPVPFQRFPVFGRFIEVPVPVPLARRIQIVAIKG
jgi:ubiquinone/menaquinone biosynthesis C-methylase UbiE